MSVRAYHPIDDYQDLYRVYRESFGPEFTERLLRDHLQTSDFVQVYEIEDKVIGYLMAECSGRFAYLSQVATFKEWRRLGFASELIKSFEKHYVSQGCDSVWLQVKAENPSQKLYFDLGYRVTMFEPNLYGPGDHGLRMEKSLSIVA